MVRAGGAGEDRGVSGRGRRGEGEKVVVSGEPLRGGERRGRESPGEDSEEEEAQGAGKKQRQEEEKEEEGRAIFLGDARPAGGSAKVPNTANVCQALCGLLRATVP